MNAEASKLDLVTPTAPEATKPETQPVATEQPTAEQPTAQLTPEQQERQQQERQVREAVVNTMLPVWGTETYAAVDTVLGYMEAVNKSDPGYWDDRLAKHIEERGLQQAMRDIHNLAAAAKRMKT